MSNASDRGARSPLRAVYDWLKGGADPGERTVAGALPARLAHYAIERKIGQGGMGVVYAARDEKLHRTVALKTMASRETDETARLRFWREARAAASVNHPNVCQIYEVGEDHGELFIAMELLEGTPLSDRLKQAPLGVHETVSTGLGILAALAALHGRGIVHRDLKPSNVFLTPHGVKLLDFGLARPAPLDETAVELTRVGAVMGTPRYMAPEQAQGHPADARADLFAAGAILFEMLAGRPAFAGNTVVAILHATVHEEPPALTGSPAVAAVDRVIRRALAKRPADRYPSAEAMAEPLGQVRATDDDVPALTHALTRVVVLPFRVLRSDPETDFLAFSLPDAITSSLSGVAPLVVRSSATAARFAGEAPDFKVIAAEAGVDRVVTGTLLRAGDALRVVAQLVEAPAGTVITSHTVQSALRDLFQLQDDVTRRLVDALALPLGGATLSPAPDRPRDGQAYELYLRANEMARRYESTAAARDLYERSVALDPRFAPAWARLGRCHRIIGKYVEASPESAARAEEAFRRALELNPRLTIAHKYYANLEADTGQSQRAVIRLVGEATRHGNDPELFAGLVHACRYCGLLDESLAAHAEARRLDPNIATSVEQTILLTGDFDRLLDPGSAAEIGRVGDGTRMVALGLSGRLAEAREALAAMSQRPQPPIFTPWAAHLAAWLDRRRHDMIETMAVMRPPRPGVSDETPLGIFEDPEAVFQEAWLLCDAGEHALGLRYVEQAFARGYFASPTLQACRQFDAVRDTPAFRSLLNDIEASRLRALSAFRDAGGDRLLGR